LLIGVCFGGCPDTLGFQKKAKSQKPNKSGKPKGKRQRNNTQTVGGVMICVMFLAFTFCFWQLFGPWLFAFAFASCLALIFGYDGGLWML
jgi:UDP-N-acetylmuramyl pentapeptide phosphotransferase/UDP-N-acetylglucosamine-1-phosphate transferase